ncbi:MAG: branched-chain amino acid ABC transporter permease [Desulfotalea sp.]
MINRHNITVATMLLIAISLPLWAHYDDQPYLLSFGSRILIYAIAAVSLDLLLGYAGLVSLGHAAFVGVGAFVVAICHFHAVEMIPMFSFPFEFNGSENGLVVFVLAIVISALAACLIGALSLRTKGMHFIMITLAFAQMLYYFFVSLETYGGDDGISLYSRNTLPLLNLGNDLHFYLFCLFCLVGFVILCRTMISSRFGLIIRGAGNNERRIKGLGINPYLYKLAIFTIAGAGAGLAGALMANQTEYVSPGLMHWTLSGELMVMVILGGLGTIFGPIIGAASFLILEETLAIYTEHWMLYMGPFLVITVIFVKGGIFGLLTGKGGKNG